jgi:hypothetical protein
VANVSRPAGLVPHSYLNGSKWNGQATVYYIPSTDNNAYCIGDPVTLLGDGDAAGVPGVVLATAGSGNMVLGPIISMGATKYGASFVDPSSLDSMEIPATKTKAYYVMVADDPNLLFEIQEDGVGGTIAAASLGSNFDLISGTNNDFVSGWLLDSSSVNTGATRQVKLMRSVQRIDNALGASCKWLVMINHHSFRPGQTGV